MIQRKDSEISLPGLKRYTGELFYLRYDEPCGKLALGQNWIKIISDKSNSVADSHALSEADEHFLWSSGHLGKHSAQALGNVNFKNVTEHFGLRGRQEHYSMMVEDFNIITSPDSAVKYVTGPTKTRQGGLRIAQRAVKPKMLATGGGKCPVMLLEEMLSRRPPELQNCGPFY